MVANTLKPSTWEAEAEQSLSLHSETLPQTEEAKQRQVTVVVLVRLTVDSLQLEEYLVEESQSQYL